MTASIITPTPTFTQALRTGALVALAATVTACLIEPFDADCAEKASCDSCMESSGCGWCSDEEYSSSYGAGRCIAGTSLGPAEDGACALTHWYFSADCLDPVCDDSCSFANDGECDEPGTCDRGTDCTDCRGDHQEEEEDPEEEAVECARATTCDECFGNAAAIEACGWCGEGGGSCLAGDDSGPDGAACGYGSWYRWPTCPSVADPDCEDTCRYALDGECDEPTYCEYGTDCSDCR
jgi:hypothetical protein